MINGCHGESRKVPYFPSLGGVLAVGGADV